MWLKPLFFRLNDIKQHKALDALILEKNPHRFDTIESQLIELLHCQNPSLKKNEVINSTLLADKLKEANSSLETYGVWVYYPWRNHLVHVLDEEEFIEVRTNRNKYKITHEEQEILRSKKIGIIGLSVGRTVATTVALERIAGEIRLADFDELELSNLNRIKTPLSQLGLNKTISAAQEILEIDPYIKVKCYTEGITESNIDSFFTDDGKIDLLVEECDGLDIKIISRIHARKLQIPVIMETNDRSMVDVERFDLEPTRPIFHGRAENLKLKDLSALTSNEDKIPYILELLDIKSTSNILRASMLEIERTILSWPQLGSSIIHGAGVVSTYIREIFLGVDVKSSRNYHQVDSYNFKNHTDERNDPPSIDFTKITAHFSGNKNIPSINVDKAKKIIKSASNAPSAGNNQPWYFAFKDNRIYLFHNIHRDKSFWDDKYLTTKLAFGCALYNLKISATLLGLKSQLVQLDNPFGQYLKPVAYVDLTECQIKKHPHTNYLSERLTNREKRKSAEINNSDITQLQNHVKNSYSYDLQFISNDKNSDLQKVIAKAERIRILHPKGHKDFVKEIRWTKKEAKSTGDGIDINTLNLSKSERIALGLMKETEVVDYLRKWDKGFGIEKLTSDSLNAGGGICILYANGVNHVSSIESGIVMQSLWLEATRLKIQLHPLASIPVLINHNSTNNQSAYGNALRQIKKELESISCIKNCDKIVMIFRLFRGSTPKTKSFRLPSEKVSSIN